MFGPVNEPLGKRQKVWDRMLLVKGEDFVFEVGFRLGHPDGPKVEKLQPVA